MEENPTYKPRNRFRLEQNEQPLVLVIGDILTATVALFASLWLWSLGDTWLGLSKEFFLVRIPSWFYLLPLFWALLLVDSYDVRKGGNMKATLKSMSVSFVVAAIIYLVIYFASEPESLPRFAVAVFLILAAVLTLIWRSIYVRLFSHASMQRRALIIGAGRAGSTLAKVISEQDPPPFNLIGLIDDDDEKQGKLIEGFPVIGCHEDLDRIIIEQNITDLILAISNEISTGMLQTILQAQEDGMNMSTMQGAYEALTNRIPISLLASDWVIRSFIERKPTSGFYRLTMRLIDLFLGLIGMVGLIVLYPIIALVIIIDSKGPVIFKQIRLGRGGKPYTIYKFRTMVLSRDMENEALVTATNDPRITSVGRFLRKSHLDEIPQIVNVLRGEMSFVGPRSERSELVSIFQREVPFYRARMLVKPGITGWAQIHQNYAETIEETAIKLEYDLFYIENASVLMDISIIIRTISNVLGFKGR